MKGYMEVRKQAERQGLKAGKSAGTVRKFLREKLRHRDDLADFRETFVAQYFVASAPRNPTE